MSERQNRILWFLRREASLAAWQLASTYRVNAPVPSIRRDIGLLRQKGYQIETTKRPYGGDLAYTLVRG